MGNHTAKWLIILSTLGLITLTLFQLNWLKQSRALIEKQFDQKVTMALCQSVDEVMDPTSSNTCTPVCCAEDMLNDQDFNSCVRTNFDKYAVDLDYELEVLSCKPNSTEKDPVYGCTLNLTDEDSAQYLAVQFPNKSGYVTSKMRFMSWSSFFLLAFIGGIFVWANYLIWKQKKLNQSNVDFFNHMAHELRTPLTSISLATKLLEKEHNKIGESKYLRLINKENSQLRNQVDLLMLSSQLEQTEKPIEKSWIPLNDILDNLKLEFELPLKEIGGKLRISDFEKDLKNMG